MTEDEAKTKWCPMVRQGYNDKIGEMNNQWAFDKLFSGKCIASGCMMWRWKIISLELAMRNADKQIPAEGYCGLAGKVLAHTVPG